MKRLLKKIFRLFCRYPAAANRGASADCRQNCGGSTSADTIQDDHECVEADINMYFDVDPETMLRK